MSNSKLGNEQLTAFIAGNDAYAKNTVMQLMKEIGFDPMDCGSLMMAIYLEPLEILMINRFYHENGNRHWVQTCKNLMCHR